METLIHQQLHQCLFFARLILYHWLLCFFVWPPLYLSVYRCICLPASRPGLCLQEYLLKCSFSVCLFVSVCVSCLPVFLSTYFPICLFATCLFAHVSACLSVYISVCFWVSSSLPVSPSLCLLSRLAAYMFVYLSVCVSAYLCVCVYAWKRGLPF